ncbi:ash family protein [Citrobacter sedlakii]|uniref:ash family protein n=1 Tax=Citrobacter sedlakii TaxID=67826 RepID=UPI0028531ECC|nr:ash family protein [Citrobacter sedlakii]MDR5007023.1 ash family protein [Citrobacter sedlakii]
MFAVLLARPALAPSMVAQAGASKEAPGRDNRYANPVWVTTSEPGVSGGGVNLLITKRSVAYVPCPAVPVAFASAGGIYENYDRTTLSQRIG